MNTSTSPLLVAAASVKPAPATSDARTQPTPESPGKRTSTQGKRAFSIGAQNICQRCVYESYPLFFLTLKRCLLAAVIALVVVYFVWVERPFETLEVEDFRRSPVYEKLGYETVALPRLLGASASFSDKTESSGSFSLHHGRDEKLLSWKTAFKLALPSGATPATAPWKRPLIVIVHGSSMPSSAYMRYQELLSLAGYASLLYDQLGFGMSDRPFSETYELKTHLFSRMKTVDYMGLLEQQLAGIVEHVFMEKLSSGRSRSRKIVL